MVLVQRDENWYYDRCIKLNDLNGDSIYESVEDLVDALEEQIDCLDKECEEHRNEIYDLRDKLRAYEEAENQTGSQTQVHE